MPRKKNIRTAIRFMTEEGIRFPYGFMVTPDEYHYINEKTGVVDNVKPKIDTKEWYKKSNSNLYIGTSRSVYKLKQQKSP